VAYIISYRMLTGTWRREVATAEAAAANYFELREAGAGNVVISDSAGRIYEITDLFDPSNLFQASGRPAEPKHRLLRWWGKQGRQGRAPKS
jgi:hypothetical protein